MVGKAIGLSMVLILFLASCSDIIDTEDNIEKSLINYDYIKSDQSKGVIKPLAVGNYWIYEVKEFDRDGNHKDTFYDTLSVDDYDEKDGEKWYMIKDYLVGKRYNEDNEHYYYYTNTNLGLWFKCDICDEESRLIARYPLPKNYFEYSSYVGDVLYMDSTNMPVRDSLYQHTLARKNVQVNVPAGNFDCHEYQHLIKPKKNPEAVSVAPVYLNYYSPDVGLVKRIVRNHYWQNNTKIYFNSHEINLIKYNLY